VVAIAVFQLNLTGGMEILAVVMGIGVILHMLIETSWHSGYASVPKPRH
jgi:hypothetical protein